MPNYQSAKAQKLAQEADELQQQAAKASEPLKSQLLDKANAKLREADEVESRT